MVAPAEMDDVRMISSKFVQADDKWSPLPKQVLKVNDFVEFAVGGLVIAVTDGAFCV